MFTAIVAIVAIGLGAALGALSRWGLALGLNHVFPALPLGTLAANLLGGYLVGLALALLAPLPPAAPEWQLFVVTGFLGSLTTFSTFSVEVVHALQAGRTGRAAATVATHVLGSLLLTLAGLATPALLTP
jgi:CrcB protein